jgi:CTP:molybdopterin cytidylyltransferase MocA
VSVAAVILAAGAGTRLGGAAKALLPGAGGRALLDHVVATARGAGVTEIACVVGPPFENEVTEAAERLTVDVVHNPDPARGMASSVALGFAYAGERFASGSALLWPVDHAAVRIDTVRAVIERARAGASDVVVPVFGGRGGHPTLFRAALWAELAACVDRPDGARGVVCADPSRVLRFDVDDPGATRDVDVPGDLERERG